MSPLLFTLYIDELLKLLANSKCGCHIGTQFHRSYGYADDIILLAPIVYSTRIMICRTYDIEFNVLFNSTKSKLIIYGHDKNNIVQ